MEKHEMPVESQKSELTSKIISQKTNILLVAAVLGLVYVGYHNHNDRQLVDYGNIQKITASKNENILKRTALHITHPFREKKVVVQRDWLGKVSSIRLYTTDGEFVKNAGDGGYTQVSNK